MIEEILFYVAELLNVFTFIDGLKSSVGGFIYVTYLLNANLS